MLWPLLGLNDAPGWLRLTAEVQFSPSSLFGRKALALTLGVTLFWLTVSLFAGRIYCSTVCPVGTLQDLVIRLRRKVDSKMLPYRFEPAKKVRFNLLWIYLATLALAQLSFAFIIEPWSIWRNIFSLAVPADVAPTWLSIGASAIAGMVFGAISLAALPLLAWKQARAFCTVVCPLGTLMGWAGSFYRTRIAIDPDKCTSCMRCEDICQSKCIKVISRHVDNSLCVRCLDCIEVCPETEKAISFISSRQRPAAPLLKRASLSKGLTK